MLIEFALSIMHTTRLTSYLFLPLFCRPAEWLQRYNEADWSKTSRGSWESTLGGRRQYNGKQGRKLANEQVISSTNSVCQSEPGRPRFTGRHCGKRYLKIMLREFLYQFSESECCHVMQVYFKCKSSHLRFTHETLSSSSSSIFNVNIITPTSRGDILRQIIS